MLRIAIPLIALSILATAAPAAAEMLDKTGRFAGTEVQYKVLTPPGYDPAKAYPLILDFPGGGQSLQGAQGIAQELQDEAARRGYIVVSPAAPNGELFFEGGDRVFPAFLDAMRKDYKIAGKIHVAGVSNGGLSAFHIALKYPAYFSTVTGYPGLMDGDDVPLAPALKPLCLYMHVGENDELGWRAPVTQEAGELKAQGYRIQFTLEKGQGHRIRLPDLPTRLFNEIESCR
jgi:poly(3-hydroxybutyrate) depolymerase